MNITENLEIFCEENKINIQGNYSSQNDYVNVGCFTCDIFFSCQIKYVFKYSEPKCKKCRRKCEHNKRKSQCKICGGSSICEHQRIKSKCKICGGSQICEHQRQKSHCKECNGSQICIHNKRKSRCKICGGSQICEHQRIKSQCKDCCGGSICEHNKRKSQCKICGGSSICIHNKIKSYCRECNGSQICEHQRIKSRCKKCGGISLCKTPNCTTYKNKKYKGYCLRCFMYLYPDIPVSRNYKIKEKDVSDRVISNFQNMTWICDKKIQNGCSRRRPDILLDLETHILIIEIDEQAHSEYDCSCENIRLHEICRDTGYRPIIMIRFNPDSYTTLQGQKIKSCWGVNKQSGICIIKNKKQWEIRIQTLFRTIEYWIKNIPNSKYPIGENQYLILEIIELFFQ